MRHERSKSRIQHGLVGGEVNYNAVYPEAKVLQAEKAPLRKLGECKSFYMLGKVYKLQFQAPISIYRNAENRLVFRTVAKTEFRNL